MGRIRYGQSGGNERIFNLDCAAGRKRYIAPDTDVAPANRGHPIPPGRCVECWVIAAQRSAVYRGSGFVFRAARIRNTNHAYRNCICRSTMNERGYVEPAAHKPAIDASYAMSVKVDFGFPVDSVEVEPR